MSFTSFLDPQITIECDWFAIETDCGGTHVECDFPVLEGTYPLDEEINVVDIAKDDIAEFGMFFAYGELVAVTRVTGYGARLSANGYLDCTEWTVHKTEQSAREGLSEYDICPKCLTEQNTELHYACRCTPAYRVVFSAHCGMRTIDTTFETDDMQSARALCANILRDRRNSGFVVSNITSIYRAVHSPAEGAYTVWECTEPEDSALVPDTAGSLSLTAVWED